jgi:hypothetical protein
VRLVKCGSIQQVLKTASKKDPMIHGQQSLILFQLLGGVDVTHGKGSIAPYVFINNEIIPIVTDQSMDQSNFSFIFSLSVLNYIIIINPTGIQPY